MNIQDNNNETKKMPPYLILSCDGGGVRGLITATILKHIQDELFISVREKFDMFVGASIGALNVCGYNFLGTNTDVFFTTDNFDKIMDKSCSIPPPYHPLLRKFYAHHPLPKPKLRWIPAARKLKPKLSRHVP